MDEQKTVRVSAESYAILVKLALLEGARVGRRVSYTELLEVAIGKLASGDIEE